MSEDVSNAPAELVGWRCDCGSFTRVSHQSTFCKVTGESDVTVHWCCPGACELNAAKDPVRLPTAEPPQPVEDLTRGATKLWFYEGAVLEPTDPSGSVSVQDLLGFAQLAQERYPDERVILHAFGLRVTKRAGTTGPRLEWRDWD